jgi:hypothetical protein
MVTFLVMNGFALLEVRKLYLDEMFDYYKYVFFHLEHRGEVKKGTYDRIDNVGQKVDNTVNILRKQIFKATNPDKKL